MDKDVAKVLDWMDRWASGEVITKSKLQRMRETLDAECAKAKVSEDA